VDESVFRGHAELVYGCLKKMNEWWLLSIVQY
jgi:hypothetical protein